MISDCQRTRQRLLIAGLLSLSSTTAFAQSSEKVMDAFWTCQSSFFEVMANNKAAFGPAKVTLRDESVPTRQSEPMRVQGFSAEFTTPGKAHDLQVLGYEQGMETLKQSTMYSWRFTILATPEEISQIIAGHVEGASLRQDGMYFVWVQEVDPKWRNADGIEQSGAVRMLLIGPKRGYGDPETSATCMVDQSRMGKMTALPPPVDLVSEKPVK